MSQHAGIDPTRRLFNLLVTLALAASLVFMVAGDLMTEQLADECENHCENDCNDCGACTHCLPLQLMIPPVQPECDRSDNDPSWSVNQPSSQDESILPAGIDHPPRNA